MAKGSSATWSPGDSRICIICGKNIPLVHGAWIHYNNLTKEHTSAHLHCGPPLNAFAETPANTHTQNPQNGGSMSRETPEPDPQPDPEPDDDNGNEDE